MTRRRTRAITLVTTAALLTISAAGMAGGGGPRTSRVSVKSNGDQADGGNFTASTSGNGRYVVFESIAENLVSDDDNGLSDIFVRDRNTAKTRRVSIRSNGDQIENGVSEDPSISANGRYVAFESDADNVVGNDVNADYDVFVHDRETGKTRMVSVDSNGDQDTTGGSYDAWISGTGRYVAFESNADDLVANDIDSTTDVFVRDRKTGKTRKVSVRTGSGIAAAGPSQDACISANGRYIAFASDDELIVPNDDNNSTDVFVRDTNTGKTRRVSVTSGGVETSGGTSRDPFISAAGRFVTFESEADNLVALDGNGVSDIFVRDRKTDKTKRVSVSSSGDETDFEGSSDPGISGNGRWVIFESGAENLVSDDDNGYYDIFVRDRKTKETIRVNVKNSGDQAELDGTYDPYISKDGRYGVFSSDAEDVVLSDDNGFADIFIRGPLR